MATTIIAGILSSGSMPGGHWSVRLASAQLAGSPAEPGAAGPGETSEQPGRQQLRDLERKEFLRQHSDATGKVRPDLELKGVQHMHRMKVAPAIGSHPAATSKEPSTAAPN